MRTLGSVNVNAPGRRAELVVARRDLLSDEQKKLHSLAERVRHELRGDRSRDPHVRAHAFHISRRRRRPRLVTSTSRRERAQSEDSR